MPELNRQEPLPGTVVAERYQVERLIARGGMAAVYLAHHIQLNRSVALKVLSPPPDAEDPDSFEQRFRLEAETLASLQHPNIVTLHDFGETSDGKYFLAMEYVDGPRLSDLLRDGPLPVDRALSLILQVCAALRYAHKRGVVHRDLKPSNLLIRRDGGEEQVKVVDFGLVKLTETDQTITKAGLILGSPHCMSPEQIKGQEVDHRADIYAVGVLLFRSITGQYPFHGANGAATMIAHLNAQAPSFFSVSPDLAVPPGLEDIVLQCLAKDRSERFRDMHTLIAALGHCLHLPPEQLRAVNQTHSTLQRVKRPEPKTRWPLLLMLGAGILAAGIFAIVAALFAMGWRPSMPRPAPIEPPAPIVQEAQPVVDLPERPVDTGVDTAIPMGDTSIPTVDTAVAPEPPPEPPVKPKKERPKVDKAPPDTKEPDPKPEEKPDAPDGYMDVPDF